MLTNGDGLMNLIRYLLPYKISFLLFEFERRKLPMLFYRQLPYNHHLLTHIYLGLVLNKILPYWKYCYNEGKSPMSWKLASSSLKIDLWESYDAHSKRIHPMHFAQAPQFKCWEGYKWQDSRHRKSCDSNSVQTLVKKRLVERKEAIVHHINTAQTNKFWDKATVQLVVNIYRNGFYFILNRIQLQSKKQLQSWSLRMRYYM